MDEQIIQKLINSNVLTEEKAREALESARQTNESVVDVLINLRLVDEESLVKVVAELKQVPYMDLHGEKISPELLSLIPPNLVSNYKVIPFAKEGNIVKIGMLNTDDMRGKDALKFALSPKGLQMQVYLISKGSFQDSTTQVSDLSSEIKSAIDNIPADPMQAAKENQKADFVGESSTPISRIVGALLKHGIEVKASDIHIEPGEKEIRIRYRIDGIMKTELTLPRKISAGLVSRIKILSSLKIDEQRKPQDGRFYTKVGGYKVDIRVSTFPSTNGEKVVMRLLDTSSAVNDLEKLGFMGRNLTMFKNNLKKTFGMILVTGPTGSGKSTTLYAGLNIINKEGVNIVTLEDPVEYYLDGANQSQVKPEIGYTFASGLRSILRQDPDIIMVGEIRDSETAELAVHSALTGHLVLSTLHTNTAIGAIPRLVDMGLEPFLITASLNMVCGQRLVKKICEKCKQPVEIDQDMRENVIDLLKSLPDSAKKLLPDQLQFYRGVGCKYCNNKGSKGRISIQEVLEMDAHMEKMITSTVTEDDLQKAAQQQGMISMQQDGVIKALQGKVALEEVWRVVNI